jgi:DNA-binding CsgD family transcriptional regulator
MRLLIPRLGPSHTDAQAKTVPSRRRTEMSVYSFLAFSVSYVCLLAGIYVLVLAPESATHRTFFLLALFAGCWNFLTAILYSADSQESIWLWFRIAAPFGILFVAMILPFVLFLTDMRPPWWVVVLILAPSTLICYESWVGEFVFESIVRENDTLVFRPVSGSLWTYVWIGYSHVLTIIALVVLLRRMRNTRSRRVKRQARVIFISLLVYAVTASAGDYLISHRLSISSISPILFVLFLIGSAYGIVRYRLFSITHRAVSGDIVAGMDMLVMMLGPDLRIVKMNHKAEAITGTTESDSIGRKIGEIMKPNPVVEEGLERVLSEDLAKFSCLAGFAPGPEQTFVELHFALVRDREGEPLGVLLTGDEIQSPRKFMVRFQITPREWETILRMSTGATNRAIGEHLHISERTVKAHITSIFSKVGVSCRTELLAALREMRVLSGVASQAADFETPRRVLLSVRPKRT